VVGLSIVVLGVIATAFVPSRSFQVADSIGWTIASVAIALMTCGIVIVDMARRRLKRGIRDEKWREDELSMLRLWLDRSWVEPVTWIPMVGWLVYVIAFQRWHQLITFGCMIIPVHLILDIKVSLNETETVLLEQDTTAKPLQSARWGQR
jgi:hypothetical protein